ncbi:MAG: uracil-DNA glycosylase [Candidatus Peribacteraceae bacterium]|nr:uracil-DNA glycosylase [Candidatus Peribacteraceae bacterium]
MDNIDKIVKDWTGCTSCDLHEDRTNQVWFRFIDNEKYTIVSPFECMIIGEAPGKQEDEDGEPFVGASGKLLDRLIEDSGINRGRAFITNTVLCRPPGNRNPKWKEMKACWGRLKRTIKAIQPRVIVTAGRLPGQFLLANKELTAKEMVGKTYRLNLDDFKCFLVPIYHPAYLLRNRSLTLERETINRLKIAKSLCQ